MGTMKLVKGNTTTNTERYHELARKGAETRVREIADELREIYRLFPVVRFTPLKASLPKPKPEPKPEPKHTGRSMTAAQRREVSKRMKAYWSARRLADQARAAQR